MMIASIESFVGSLWFACIPAAFGLGVLVGKYGPVELVKSVLSIVGLVKKGSG